MITRRRIRVGFVISVLSINDGVPIFGVSSYLRRLCS